MAEMMTTNSGNGEHTTYEKKYVYKEDHNDYASKGVAGTALGIGIGALALTLLNRNGNNVLSGLLGTPNDNQMMENDLFRLYKSQVDADFAIYKGYRDQGDSIVAKHNADAFQLYKYSRDGFDALQSEISDLKTKIAVQEAVEPWKNKSIYDAIALEAERRQAADCSLVGYMNCTFIPQYIADITPAATSTQKTLGNPLNCLRPNCGC